LSENQDPLLFFFFITTKYTLLYLQPFAIMFIAVSRRRDKLFKQPRVVNLQSVPRISSSSFYEKNRISLVVFPNNLCHFSNNFAMEMFFDLKLCFPVCFY